MHTLELFTQQLDQMGKFFDFSLSKPELSTSLSTPGFACSSLSSLKAQVHPLHFVPLPDDLKLTRSLDTCLQDPSYIQKWKNFLSLGKVVYFKNLDQMLRFYFSLRKNIPLIPRVQKFMIARELAHVEAQKNNPIQFLWWNVFLFRRRNLTSTASFIDHLPITGMFPFLPLILYPLCGVSIPLVGYVVSAIIAIALMTFDLINLYVARNQEKFADDKALKITKDKEAAQLFFQALKAGQKESYFFLRRF